MRLRRKRWRRRRKWSCGKRHRCPIPTDGLASKSVTWAVEFAAGAGPGGLLVCGSVLGKYAVSCGVMNWTLYDALQVCIDGKVCLGETSKSWKNVY